GIVAGRYPFGVEVLVAGDVAQRGQGGAQVPEQRQQRLDLGVGIRLVHRLVGHGQPVRPAAAVHQFDPDRARVVAAHVVGDAFGRHVFDDAAVAVDVPVAAVAGAAAGVAHLLAERARGGEVGQFRAVDDHQVHGVEATGLE